MNQPIIDPANLRAEIEMLQGQLRAMRCVIAALDRQQPKHRQHHGKHRGHAVRPADGIRCSSPGRRSSSPASPLGARRGRRDERSAFQTGQPEDLRFRNSPDSNRTGSGNALPPRIVGAGLRGIAGISPQSGSRSVISRRLFLPIWLSQCGAKNVRAKFTCSHLTIHGPLDRHATFRRHAPATPLRYCHRTDV